MGIGIQSEAGLRMAQDAGQGLGIHPAGQGMGGEGMAQIVEPKIRQPRLLQQAFQTPVGVARTDRLLRAERIRENPLCLRGLFSLPQKLGCARREQDGPCPRIGLCASLLHPAALPGVDRAAYF